MRLFKFYNFQQRVIFETFIIIEGTRKKIRIEQKLYVQFFFKRILDLLASLFGFILSLPLFLIILLILLYTNKGKPFFFQHRPGKDEKIFSIIKFKTMNDKKDANGNLLTDVDRTTKIGNLIRKTSLDEIPQLLNVIMGDMSLIGPRPLLGSYLPLYSKEQNKRHNVKPGITGWAQVNGRNAISWKEKFNYDVQYVNNLSFALDLRIILMTIKKVFLGHGVNSGSNETMPPFTEEDDK